MKIIKVITAIVLIGVVFMATNIKNGKQPKLHLLSIIASDGGTIPAGVEQHINGEYAEGATIHLAARAFPGYKFKMWTTNGEGSFVNDNASVTTFRMSNSDVKVTAIFEKTN